jgi:hypothetical protein
MNLPEITEVQRLTLKPGDRIVIRADQVLTNQQAHELTQMARVRLRLPEDAPLFVLGKGMSLEVVDGLA